MVGHSLALYYQYVLSFTGVGKGISKDIIFTISCPELVCCYLSISGHVVNCCGQTEGLCIDAVCSISFETFLLNKYWF